MNFYINNETHQKDLRDKGNKDWRAWGLDKFTKLARQNPVHFLSKGKFYHYDEINQNFYLDRILTDYLNPALSAHLKDILEYRRIDYFRACTLPRGGKLT